MDHSDPHETACSDYEWDSYRDYEQATILRQRNTRFIEDYQNQISHILLDRDKALSTSADLTLKRLGVEEDLEKWVGIALRGKFILDEIIKIGALREDVDWVAPLVEDFVMPDISISIRHKFLPSYHDQPIDDDEDEEETYRRLSEEASEFSEDHLQLLRNTQDPDDIKKIIQIQAIWRGYNDRVLKGCRFMPQAHIDHLKKSEYVQRFWYPLALTRDKQRTITLVNTGNEPMYIYWLKSRRRVGPPIKIPNVHKIRRGGTTNILTQLGNWFLITSDSDIGSRNITNLRRGGPGMKYIHIGPRFVDSSIFDVQSGFMFSNEHWSSLSNSLIQRDALSWRHYSNAHSEGGLP